VTSFELIDNPLDGESASHYDDYCDCPIPAKAGHPVRLAVEDGSISIVCANCRRGFAFLDDLEGVSSVEIPMVLTYHDTTISNPIVGTEYDGYWELTLPEVKP